MSKKKLAGILSVYYSLLGICAAVVSLECRILNQIEPVGQQLHFLIALCFFLCVLSSGVYAIIYFREDPFGERDLADEFKLTAESLRDIFRICRVRFYNAIGFQRND